MMVKEGAVFFLNYIISHIGKYIFVRLIKRHHYHLDFPVSHIALIISS